MIIKSSIYPIFVHVNNKIRGNKEGRLPLSFRVNKRNHVFEKKGETNKINDIN
jgi:hypothetical protein